MNAEQFELWKDFSSRMVKTCYKNATPRRRNKLEELAIEFINDVKEDGLEDVSSWESITDWFDDRFADYLDTIWDERSECYRDNKPYFYDQLHCIVRAGIDIAMDGYGVLGWTVGDLKEMYPGETPSWIIERYGHEFFILPNETGVWF